jgi:hypothetical protein
MSMLPVRRSCLDRRQTVGTPRRARPGLSPSARSGARAPGASRGGYVASWWRTADPGTGMKVVPKTFADHRTSIHKKRE